MNKVCLRCKKINLNMNKEAYCPSCYALEMREFEMVKNYVHAHPNCTVLDVVTSIKIDLKVVERMIKMGSISFKSEHNHKKT